MVLDHAMVKLHVHTVHDAGELLPTEHVLEHWLEDVLEENPKLGTVELQDDDGHVKTRYHVEICWPGHRIEEVDGEPRCHVPDEMA